MRLLSSWSASAATLLSLLSSTLVQDVLAAPQPSPKAPWVTAGRQSGRKALHNALVGKRMERRNATAAPACADMSATSITAPSNNIWEPMADADAAAVASWLFAQADLNLTRSENATDWDNTVLLIEALPPNKTDALAYIDNNVPLPPQYAHVVLSVRSVDEPYFQDITVGPLPISNCSTRWAPLTYTLTKKDDGKVRTALPDSELLSEQWYNPIFGSIADITLELYNATAAGYDNDTAYIFGADPPGQVDGRIIQWDTFWLNPPDFDASTLLPQGLFLKSDLTGRDPAGWKLLGWLYNDIFYDSTDAFRTAFFSPGFEKLPANLMGDWARSDPVEPAFPMDKMYPPTSVAPAGSRFAVDQQEKYVEWMGFSFYIGFQRDTGMSLHDVRFNGTRILYEVGLQEALAHYAGNDPVQSGTSYLDSYYGFGPFAFELVPGYDCPSYATYLNSSFYVTETTHTHIDSICLFEYDADYPMQRHSAGHYVSVSKNTYFSVRSVSTVGNYDYMFTYTFFIDGSMAVEVRASGYIQAAYYKDNQEYGFHVHDALSGSMHDHVLNFKADFDVLGTNNSIQLMQNIPVKESYVWSDEPRYTMKLNRSFIESEDQGKFDWDQNAATQVIIVNKNETNSLGEYRGYRILPYTGVGHLIVQNSSNIVNAAHWAEHDLHFTRQKDTELRSAHPYNNQDVNEPPVDFSKFLDGESLDQEDLVVWFNLGMHHVPHTGDLPNTVFTTAHSGVQFMPSNYYAGDLSRHSTNAVRVVYNSGDGTSQPVTFGAEDDGVCGLDYEPVGFDLTNYVGDVVIRKLPYDPEDPYYETDAIS